MIGRKEIEFRLSSNSHECVKYIVKDKNLTAGEIVNAIIGDYKENGTLCEKELNEIGKRDHRISASVVMDNYDYLLDIASDYSIPKARVLKNIVEYYFENSHNESPIDFKKSCRSKKLKVRKLKVLLDSELILKLDTYVTVNNVTRSSVVNELLVKMLGGN